MTKKRIKTLLSFYRKYKIQDVIKKDQVLLIQIVKEERGTKGAAITTFISYQEDIVYFFQIIHPQVVCQKSQTHLIEKD